jgi:hypothetical protein
MRRTGVTSHFLKIMGLYKYKSGKGKGSDTGVIDQPFDHESWFSRLDRWARISPPNLQSDGEIDSFGLPALTIYSIQAIYLTSLSPIPIPG